MATFVLVGGAWMGAWVWRDVTRLLRDRADDSYAGSLVTGVADRIPEVVSLLVDCDSAPPVPRQQYLKCPVFIRSWRRDRAMWNWLVFHGLARSLRG